jgi:hypothetical protein
MSDGPLDERVHQLEETVADLGKKLDLVNSLVTRHLGQATPPKGECVLADRQTDRMRKVPTVRYDRT